MSIQLPRIECFWPDLIDNFQNKLASNPRGYSELSFAITFLSDPSPDYDTESGSAMYWAHQFSIVTEHYPDTGGYIGIQTSEGNGRPYKIINYAIWGASTATPGTGGPEESIAASYTAPFGGEGEGWRSQMTLMWEIGETVTFKVVDNGDRSFTASVMSDRAHGTDPPGTWWTIATISGAANTNRAMNSVAMCDTTDGFTSTDSSFVTKSAYADGVPTMQGDKLVQITKTSAGTGTASAILGSQYGAIYHFWDSDPGQAFTFFAHSRAVTNARNFNVQAIFYNSGGTAIGTATGTAVADGTASWTRAMTQATIPAGAETYKLMLSWAGVPQNESHWVEEIAVNVGTAAGTAWTPTGEWRGFAGWSVFWDENYLQPFGTAYPWKYGLGDVRIHDIVQKAPLNYLNADGSVYATADDNVAYPTGTAIIDVKVWLEPTTWTGQQCILSQWDTNQNAWQLITIAGQPAFNLSADGTTNAVTLWSGATLGTARQWLRAQVWPNDGYGNSVAFFYTSLNGLDWTQLADPAQDIVVNVHDSTAPICVGCAYISAPSYRFRGKIYELAIAKGTVIATRAHFWEWPSNVAVGNANVYDGYGNERWAWWTLHGGTAVSAGSVVAIPPDHFTHSDPDYSPGVVPAYAYPESGVFPNQVWRMTAGAAFVPEGEPLGVASAMVEIAFGDSPWEWDPDWIDVTAFVTTGSIRGGRSEELQRFSGRTATFVFRNEDRQMDPRGPSPYAAQMRPRKQIRLTAVDSTGVRHTVFRGWIAQDGWSLDYTAPSGATASVKCVDIQGPLASIKLPKLAAPTYDYDLPVQRIARVFEAYNIPPNWLVGDEGDTVLGPTDYNKTAIEFCHKVAESDAGVIYTTNDGPLKFARRYAFMDTNMTDVQATFSTDEIGTAPSPLISNFTYDPSSLFYNRVRMTRTGGTVQESYDQASIDANTESTYDLSDLQMRYDADALTRTQWIVHMYKEPLAVVDTIEFPAHRGVLEFDAAIKLDFQDRVKVMVKVPGSDTMETEEAWVEQISHTINFAQRSWRTTFGLANASRFDFADETGFLILDDTDVGRLGIGRLGF